MNESNESCLIAVCKSLYLECGQTAAREHCENIISRKSIPAWHYIVMSLVFSHWELNVEGLNPF